MRKLPLAVVTGLFMLGGGGALVRAQRPTPRPLAVPGQLIVKFKANAAPRDKMRARGRIAAAALAELVRSPRARSAGSIELVRIADAAPLQAAIAALRADPAVEYAEPNWIYTHAAPNDPSYAQQWALENTGQAVGGMRGTVDADIDAELAWQHAASARTVYVGVLDEGIDFNHPDLGVQPGGAIWTNPFDAPDGVDNDGNGYVDDVHGWDFHAGDNSVYDGNASNIALDSHGTHVAGILGARTNNGIGIAGVSPGVVIIPTKFMGVGATGTVSGTTAHAVLALDYLTDLKTRHNLNIVATNNSWTGGGFSQALLDAIVRAGREDILFVAAAGNGGPDEVADNNDTMPTYPGSYDTTPLLGWDAVISVTATDQSDQLPSWANYGFSSVDLGAPGTLIASTTPQNTYTYSSGTSMATPLVTGAAVLVNATRGLIGQQLKDAILSAVDPVSSLAGRTVTGGRLNLARAVYPGLPTSGGGSNDADEIVLYAADAPVVTGNWRVVADASAAGGSRLQNSNLGAAKVAPALAAPADYFELTFQAQAGRPYHLWLRGRAEGNSWANDSVHVQFDRSVDGGGNPLYRIGTTGSAEVNLEDCSGCGVGGWGWQDNGYGLGTLGPAVYFQTTGTQKVRVQVREDGIGIDQIVLSASRFAGGSPGRLKNDATILSGGAGPAPAAVDEVVLYTADATEISGDWSRAVDSSAAGGVRLQHNNANTPKIVTALANPTEFFEMTFTADAHKSYRLWIRGRALGNSWANDSVHVQFSDSLTASSAAAYRIGTTSSAEVNLEDCGGCGLSGWGWQDNGYGAGVLGPEIRFATSGTHTIRVQIREDGLGLDQIVLSAQRYLTSAPGPLKNDTTILPR